MRPVKRNVSLQHVKHLPAKTEHIRLLPSSRELLTLLADYLSKQWAELMRLRRSVLHRFDDVDIHDLRVASRRVRVAIALLEPLLESRDTVAVRRSAQKLTRELGYLRNLDEARNYFLRLPTDELTQLTAKIDRQRRKEARRVKRVVLELPCNRLEIRMGKIGQALATSELMVSQGIFALLAERNLALYRPIYALLQTSALPDLAEERHALRIAVKKWRYFNELLAFLLQREPYALLEQLKLYQTVLGDLNDREVFLGMARCANTLTPSAQRKLETVIAGQHRRLTTKFRKMLKQHPLQYQFVI